MAAELRKVLIVDDEPDACASLKRILSLDQYQVDIAHTMTEALSSRNWSDYFAVLLDRRLPDGSAEELLPRIKQLSPTTAVLIVTGHADLNSSIDAIRLGAEDYILKPINVDALRASLARVLRVRVAEQRAAHAERLAGIGQMMAGIAHESRNAIQRIQTAVDLLKLDFDSLPTDTTEQITKIEKANEDLQHMLDEIRDFSAPINLELDAVHISAIWRRAWKNVSTVHAEKDLRFEESLDHTDPICTVDSFRLEQVFRNLFENSIAACNVIPRIEVGCSRINHHPRSRIQISVRDNGPGFGPEETAMVFEPFFTTKQRGTGLGLAIVKRVVEAHGGSIEIGTDDRKGAEILICLPESGVN